MFTRQEIIDFSARIGCKGDLIRKGMVVSPSGDVICIAALTGDYPDSIYYLKNIKSPKEAYYCGVYSVRASNSFDLNCSETRKNIAVKQTDGIDTFVYLFEKTLFKSDRFFFHGRYTYRGYKFVKSSAPDHEEDVLFHLLFIDRPIIK